MFPVAPVRQWVLSLPFALRYRLAWDHALARKVLRVFWRALDHYQRKRAKERGLANARTGAVTVIQRAGRRVRRLGEEPDDVGAPPKRKRHARHQGFDLHAGAPVRAKERDRLERMLRYMLRPPIPESRLRELSDGTILLGQKAKWSDGTTHLVFEPMELLERLAAIIPRPQVNLVIYHGVLAPNAKWRSRAVAYGRSPEALEEKDDNAAAKKPRPRYYAWADLMRRTFGYDVMACLECGGRMKLLAMIEEPAVIAKILDHLGLPTEPPRTFPARAPPEKPGQLDLPEPDASFDW